jgi:hypothetical protein
MFLKHLEASGKVALQINDKETKIKYLDLNQVNLKEKHISEMKEREILYEENKRRKEFEKYNKLAIKDKNENNSEPLIRNGEIAITLKKSEKIELKIDKDLLGHKRHHHEDKPVFEKFNSSEPWVQIGLQVRIKDKSLSDHFNKKGKIINLINEYFTEVDINNTIIKIDQEHLDPVIPPSGDIKILYGIHKGQTATIDTIDIKAKTVKLKGKTELFDLKGICKY